MGAWIASGSVSIVEGWRARLEDDFVGVVGIAGEAGAGVGEEGHATGAIREEGIGDGGEAI